MKTIGIIGGMSFESTITYYKIINQAINDKLKSLNSAKILLYSVNFEEIEILQKQDKWQEAAQILSECAKKLELAGVDFIIITTNTMHKVFDEIQKSINIPVLHIAKSTAKALKQENIQKVGLLGTKYTMTQDFYKKILEEENISTIIPSDEDIKIVHDIIFNELCKGEIKQESKEKYLNIIKKLQAMGAKGVVLACTEIGLLVSKNDTNINIFDTSIIHALDAANEALKD
ncbi:TPA: aspartate/glutamate racemase family protein [Campylobacter jejuni]|nr:aspartate/glutamate racemase family protein [Campylobacter jejuni]HDZ4937290.1 aspartate/glutamate racemase family protein [Campylobacter jejuni]HDZ4941056.1 aspartate/glutamate racemase family protein [Campylobacter jejuni]HDZ4944188.1 aspartate/glutamate racemase family protein [Campylobacter jejuni]HDZ4946173.1 aspartate/glutamate racemase family protein [Campylobacter jejuni]